MSPPGVLADALAAWRAAPERSAILLDIDGVLAPIVAEASAAAVPASTSALLARLAERYALVGCVTGRRARDARAMVGLDALEYVGMHGTERLPAGGGEPELDPAFAAWAPRVHALKEELDTPELRAAGITWEDKGPVVALHWRRAEDPAAAERAVQGAATRAQEAGLAVHEGRKVLELRPPLPMDKGAGVRALLADRAVDRALFAGDDTTDLDAFRALGELRDEGRLQEIARIGVASDEGPEAVTAEADLVVEGPEGLADLLDTLLRDEAAG